MNSKFKMFYTWDPSDPPRYHHKVVDGEYFEWLFSMLAGTGVTFLYRCNLAGRAYYPSRIMAPFDHSCAERSNPNPEAALWHRVADMLDVCDPFAEAVRAARWHGVPIWAWFNWNEFQCIRRDWVYLVDPVWYEQPRKYWCTRDGSRFYHGVPAFGDEDVRRRLLGLAQEAASYGVDGLYLSTRSHSWQPCFDTPQCNDNLEPFGFNDCVVEAYRKRHGVDIRYEEYDEKKWLRIKGEQFSTLIHRVGSLLHRQNMQFIVGLVPDRYTLMGMKDTRPSIKQLRLYKDWETWVKEKNVDGICAEQTCPHEHKLTGADIAVFQKTLPTGFPVFTWADTARFVPHGGGPFSLANWDRNSVEEVMKQIEMAEKSGAAGIALHSLYHFTAADTQGESIGGYGILPRREYLEALKKRKIG